MGVINYKEIAIAKKCVSELGSSLKDTKQKESIVTVLDYLEKLEMTLVKTIKKK